ncbi:hypothetical protein Bbelb_054190 [Branchiostoma belcheri]|nr:hypothetical protein Bbelb_054190 [Branchiostoma belcheri]
MQKADEKQVGPVRRNTTELLTTDFCMEPCAEVPLLPSSAVDSEAEIVGHDKLTPFCALYRDTAGDQEGTARNEHEKTPYALYQNTTVQKDGWGSRNTLITENEAVTSLYQDTGRDAPTAMSRLYGDNEDREESSQRIGRSNGQDNGQENPLSLLYTYSTAVDDEVYGPAPPCDQNTTCNRNDVVQTGATTPKQAKENWSPRESHTLALNNARDKAVCVSCGREFQSWTDL